MMARAFRAVSVVSVVLASHAAAQETRAAEYPRVEVTGRLQEQFFYFDNDPYAAVAGPESGFLTRRARIELTGEITERVGFVIQPSYEAGRPGGVRLRDAYIRLRLTPAGAPTTLTLQAGQAKRPFGRYELTSSKNLPSIERGAGDGLLGVASNDVFGDNGFLSHDVGAGLRLDAPVSATNRLTLQVGVYNGQGESLDDVNSAKSFGARATVDITDRLNVGASYFRHDQILATGAAPDSGFANDAWGLDAQWGEPGADGLYVVADYMRGEAATAAREPLAGLSLIGAYYLPMAGPGSWLAGIEPAVRFDMMDPNTDLDDDRATLVTAVLGFYLSKQAHLRIGYERQGFEADGLEAISGVRSAVTVSF